MEQWGPSAGIGAPARSGPLTGPSGAPRRRLASGEGAMAYVALITWFVTILPGLYMLAVWLIENDAADRNAAASRLPAPVIFTHLLLAVTGLGVWVSYLLFGHKVLAWTAFSIL